MTHSEKSKGSVEEGERRRRRDMILNEKGITTLVIMRGDRNIANDILYNIFCIDRQCMCVFLSKCLCIYLCLCDGV